MSPEMDFWRQLDIISPDQLAKLKVTLIGLGGIGSPTCLVLAKMGAPDITIYDDDIVENHNLPNQFYRFSDLGKPKVEAMAAICQDFAGLTIKIKNERYSNQDLSGVVISGVDTMEVRKQIWTKVKYNPWVELYIEGRMAPEFINVYSVKSCDPSHIRWYERNLYTDEEAVDLPCTARSLIYTNFMIAALIANQVKAFLKGEDVFEEILADFVTKTFSFRRLAELEELKTPRPKVISKAR
jgi:hypothetical protein